jgi:hypothetical protein
MNHSVFAIELCMRLEPGSVLREELKDLVMSHPVLSTPGQKWQLLKRASELLVKNDHLYEMGCWDFFDSDERALKDYDMWSNGMITEEGARKEPSWDPQGQDPRFMTFTIALLLVNGSKSERELAQVCNVPEDFLWNKSTFRRVLKGLAHVNFAFVKSDVMYLIPGEESWGLTPTDLKERKFEYLRSIRER